jgi:hypothetical protein
MLDPVLRIAALGIMVVPFTAPTRDDVFEAGPPLRIARADTDSLLIATLSNGEIQSHWLQQPICERIVSELRAASKVSAISSDGTVLNIERANCSLRNSQLGFPVASR